MSFRTFRICIGTQGFDSWLSKYPHLLERCKKEFILEGRALVAFELVKQAPRRTGRLRGSVVSEATPDGFEVYPLAPYTRFVDQGTGFFSKTPHFIFPRKAKVLRFMIEGRVVFARWTVGMKGRFFIKKTKEIIRPKLVALVQKIWRRLHRV